MNYTVIENSTCLDYLLNVITSIIHSEYFIYFYGLYPFCARLYFRIFHKSNSCLLDCECSWSYVRFEYIKIFVKTWICINICSLVIVLYKQHFLNSFTANLSIIYRDIIFKKKIHILNMIACYRIIFIRLYALHHN